MPIDRLSPDLDPPPDIHWEEGTFLLPHHFQRAQQQASRRVGALLPTLLPFAYGLLDQIEIAQGELAQGVLRVIRLRALLPGGILVTSPGNTAELVSTISLAAGKSAATIHLAVSRHVPGTALAYDPRVGTDTLGPDKKAAPLSRYVVKDEEVDDENSGIEGDRKTLRVRKVNARLLVDPTARELEHVDSMPILRVLRGASERLALDPDFAAPALTLHAVPEAWKLIQALASDLEQARSRTARWLVAENYRPDDLRPNLVEPLVRLRTLSWGAAALRHAVTAHHVDGHEVFGTLLHIHAELAALSPQDVIRAGPYDHDNPLPEFKKLCTRIRELMERIVSSVQMIKFVRQGRYFEASVPTAEWERPILYLGIVAPGVQTNELARLVEDPRVFKVMPSSEKSENWNGVVTVRAERAHPALPSEPVYFELQRGEGSSRTRWDRARQEQVLSIRWPDSETSNWSLALYLPVVAEARR